jgi:hypothetical protein
MQHNPRELLMNNKPRKLLLVYPHEYICQLFKSNVDIIFFDERGWWVLDSPAADRRLVEIKDIEIDFSGSEDARSILDRIDWWGPIWHRWVAHADQYELLKREALLHILKVKAGLKYFEIDNAIFHTGISHHVDISLVEIACAELKVPQVFLYANVINGRLLPMIQIDSIKDRRPLGQEISSYDSTEDIQKFLANKLKGNTPVLNGTDSDSSRSFAMANYSLFRSHVRGYVGAKIKKYTGRSTVHRSPLTAKPFGLNDHLRLIKEQKMALDFYLRNCLTQNDIQKRLENETAIPFIAAHYQPEATSFPEGGDLSNHVDIALRLRSLNVKSDIAYKEHPGSWMYYAPIVGATRVGMSRSVSYYEQLLDLGCKFLPPSYDLKIRPQVRTWYLPITITGTISIERSLFGLSTICAGQPWYKGLPGTYSLAELNDFRSLPEGIKDSSLLIQRDAISFLSAQLNGTTLINRQGLGSGRPLNDDVSKKEFNFEFTNLVNYFLKQ